MSSKPFAALQAGAIDGRTRTVYYRQDQLERLFKALVANEKEIVEAIVSDSGNTLAEAQVEYALALTQVKERYAELDPKVALEDEYAVAHGKDAADLRIGYGIVYIQAAADHTLFYSTVAPLSGAIAAGNCVLLRTDNNLRKLPALLRKVLKGALDSDTFDIAQEPVKDEAFLEGTLQVIQSEAKDGPAAQNQLLSKVKSISAAVVDRTANLDAAAKALVFARFAFNGRSPYAPDLILVNEFVKKDFLQAVLKYSVSFGETVAIENGALDKKKPRESGLQELVAKFQKDGDTRVVAQESNRAIVEVGKRNVKLLQNKITEPCLLVHTVKSLDDAIDFVNNNGPELLAGYYFAQPAQSKYLSQFISSQVSFVNQIPADLLVGPAYPTQHPVTATRYPTSIFTRQTPAFVHPSSASNVVSQALTATSKAEKAKAVQRLYEEAVSDLPKRKRAKQLAAGFGFFEQALVVNLSVLLVTLGCTIAGGVVLTKRLRR